MQDFAMSDCTFLQAIRYDEYVQGAARVGRHRRGNAMRRNRLRISLAGCLRGKQQANGCVINGKHLMGWLRGDSV